MLTNLLYIVLAILVLTTFYVVVRTIIFEWSQGSVEKIEGVRSTNSRSPSTLPRLCAVRQYLWMTAARQIPQAFQQLHQMLRETYPLVHEKLRREVVNGYSLLYIWQGKRADLEPVMLMAHQDVVSADPTEWTYPPFEGKIVDGFIWGRGTLDIKNQLIGIMEAAEALLQAGIPSRANHSVRAGA